MVCYSMVGLVNDKINISNTTMPVMKVFVYILLEKKFFQIKNIYKWRKCSLIAAINTRIYTSVFLPLFSNHRLNKIQ